MSLKEIRACDVCGKEIKPETLKTKEEYRKDLCEEHRKEYLEFLSSQELYKEFLKTK